MNAVEPTVVLSSQQLCVCVCVCVCATCLVEAGPCVHAMEATVVLSYGFAWASKMMQFVSAGVVLG